MKRGRPKLKKGEKRTAKTHSFTPRALWILENRVKNGEQSSFLSALVEFYDSARSANEKISYTDIDAHLFGEEKR